VFLSLRHVLLRINGIDWALRNTNRAINALIGIDGEEIRAFTKTVNWTDIYTVGVFASDTGFGDNVGHDKSVVEELRVSLDSHGESVRNFFYFN
jgi:hypothetical protein